MPTQGTMERLLQLAEVAGRAAGIAHAQALIAYEQAEQAALPPTPIDVLVTEIVGMLPTWAKEAARSPREVGSQQAQLLAKVHALMVAQREAAENGDQPG